MEKREMNIAQFDRMHSGKGFIAALDQSGGSTPKALALYGVQESSFTNDDEMYTLVHEMRTRIIKSTTFESDYILGAILFENTMDRKIDGQWTADFLWEKKNIVPFLKVDKGLADLANGVQLMKPISNLEELLTRAVERNIFGTKTESKPKIQTITDIDRLNPNLFEATIAAIYNRQGFEVYLTPYSNDKGVDVVVLKNGENYLIQAKQTKSPVGRGAVQEICTAKTYYEEKFKEHFNLLAITNNEYSSLALMLAKSNNIQLINRKQLERLINITEITLQDINKIESQRLSRV